VRLKRDGTRAETRFRLSPKRTSPFKSAGASVQSTAGSRDVCISGSNAGHTKFRGSVSVLATYSVASFPFTSPAVRHRVPSGFKRNLQRPEIRRRLRPPPSMATKSREAIAPGIFRPVCVIFRYCKASAMGLDRPNQGGTQPTRLNHSGFKSPANIQPSHPHPPKKNHNAARRKHAKAHSQDRKYAALSKIAVTVRRYPRYRPAMRTVCENGPTDQGTNGPRLISGW